MRNWMNCKPKPDEMGWLDEVGWHEVSEMVIAPSQTPVRAGDLDLRNS